MRTYLKDLAYRTAATYLETLAGLTTAAGFGWLDLGAWKAAAVAAAPAAYTVVKGAIARWVGNPNQAALIDTTKE